MKQKPFKYFIIFIIFITFDSVLAQNKTREVDLKVSSSGIFSTKNHLPFWNQANQYGVITNSNPLIYTTLTPYIDYDSSLNKFRKIRHLDFGVGLEAVISLNTFRPLQLPEYYFKTRYKKIEFFLGRKKAKYGLNDSTMSSGSYAMSGNAIPIPMISLHFPDFVPLLKNNLISFKGQFSHGWFENSRPVTKELKLHQKSLYLKLGKPNWQINFYSGINHYAQWGGKSIFNTKDGVLPQSFKDYLNVVTGKKISDEDSRLSEFDYTNRVGNHIGTVDLGLTVKLKHTNLFFYRQNIFEDGSLFYLTNISDGLSGLSISNSGVNNRVCHLNKIVFEFLNTTSQGGKYFNSDAGGYLRGMDDYFNNAQIRDGWSYLGRTIGTPFITPRNDAQNSLAEFTDNNRTRMFFIGMEMTLVNQFSIIAKNAFSYNWGRYVEPFSNVKKQNSLQIGLIKRMKSKSFVRFEICNDTGSLYPNSTSVKFTYSKSIVW